MAQVAGAPVPPQRWSSGEADKQLLRTMQMLHHTLISRCFAASLNEGGSKKGKEVPSAPPFPRAGSVGFGAPLAGGLARGVGGKKAKEVELGALEGAEAAVIQTHDWRRLPVRGQRLTRCPLPSAY